MLPCQTANYQKTFITEISKCVPRNKHTIRDRNRCLRYHLMRSSKEIMVSHTSFCTCRTLHKGHASLLCRSLLSWFLHVQLHHELALTLLPLTTDLVSSLDLSVYHLGVILRDESNTCHLLPDVLFLRRLELVLFKLQTISTPGSTSPCTISVSLCAVEQTP